MEQMKHLSTASSENPDAGQTESETIDDVSPLSSGRSKQSEFKESKEVQQDPPGDAITSGTQTQERWRQMRKTETILSNHHSHEDHHLGEHHQHHHTLSSHGDADTLGYDRKGASFSGGSSRRSTLPMELLLEDANHRTSLARSVTFNPMQFEVTNNDKEEDTPRNSDSESDHLPQTPPINGAEVLNPFENNNVASKPLPHPSSQATVGTLLKPVSVTQTPPHMSNVLSYASHRPTISSACSHDSCKRSGLPCSHRKWCKVCRKTHSMCNPYIEFILPSYPTATIGRMVKDPYSREMNPIQTSDSLLNGITAANLSADLDNIGTDIKPPLSPLHFNPIRSKRPVRPKSSASHKYQASSTNANCPTCYRLWQSLDCMLDKEPLSRSGMSYGGRSSSQTSPLDFKGDFRVNDSRNSSHRMSKALLFGSYVDLTSFSKTKDFRMSDSKLTRTDPVNHRQCPICVKKWNSMSLAPRSFVSSSPTRHSRMAASPKKWQSVEALSRRSTSPAKQRNSPAVSLPKEEDGSANNEDSGVASQSELPKSKRLHAATETLENDVNQSDEQIKELTQEIEKLRSQMDGWNEYVKAVETENEWLKTRLNDQEDGLLRRESHIQGLLLSIEDLQLRPACGEACARDRALLQQVLQDLELLHQEYRMKTENYSILEQQLMDTKRQCQEEVNRGYNLQVEVERLLAERNVLQDRLRMQQWRERELVEREALLRKALDYTSPQFSFDNSRSRKDSKKPLKGHDKNKYSSNWDQSPPEFHHDLSKTSTGDFTRSSSSFYPPGGSSSQPVYSHLKDNVKFLLRDGPPDGNRGSAVQSLRDPWQNETFPCNDQPDLSAFEQEYQTLIKEKEKIDFYLNNEVPVGTAAPAGRRPRLTNVARGQLEEKMKVVDAKLQNLRQKLQPLRKTRRQFY